MLSDQEKTAQRAFERKLKDLQAMLHEMGGTHVGARQHGSAELAYANLKLREANHWVREHYFVNVITKNRPPMPPIKRREYSDRNGNGEGM